MTLPFHAVGKEQDFLEDHPRVVQVGTKPVCVLRRKTGWVAFDDYCPHRAGPLSEGVLRLNTLACPWHGARFDLDSGKCVSGPDHWKLKLRQVVIENGLVSVSSES